MVDCSWLRVKGEIRQRARDRGQGAEGRNEYRTAQMMQQ